MQWKRPPRPGPSADSTEQRFDSLRPVRGYRFISASVVSALRLTTALRLTSLLTSRSGRFQIIIIKKKKKISSILESAAVEQPRLGSEAMLGDVINPAAGSLTLRRREAAGFPTHTSSAPFGFICPSLCTQLPKSADLIIANRAFN